MSATRTLSPTYPLGSRIDEAGHLEVGGCDAIELAREFGTPAYVVVEDDIRARARAFREALASRHGSFDLLFASKAFPCTAVYRLLAAEGFACDVASGGELHLALAGGFDPDRIYLHGNAKSAAELRQALDAGVGRIVIDSFDEIERLARLVAEHGGAQKVLIRVRPGVTPATHAFISTGQADSKFGFSVADVPRAIERVRDTPGLELTGLHMHIGSQLLDLDAYHTSIAALAPLGEFPEYNLGGGLGVAYTASDAAPSIESWVDALVGAAHELLPRDARIVIEPGRALVANSTVTLYTVEAVKRSRSTYVAVDGGMSDNLRPMLYGSVYEAQIADRFGGGELCQVVGKHCESSDVIVRDVELRDPRSGDVLVTPATGAYGHAMASNYNGVTRPPVVFCSQGRARVVMRRETYADLVARDVPGDARP